MGFKQGIRALLSGMALVAALHAPAAVLDNLYQVQLTQQEDQSRDQALREATVVMLQRLAGQNVDLKHQAIANALKSPQELMSRIATAEGGQLRIQFEPDALGRVLKQSGQPLLGPNRPGILLWAVEAGELGDRLLSPVAPRALLLKQAAQHRGVALSFPLADLQDLSLVSEQVIRQASSEELLEASKRYPTDGTLALVVGGSDENTELQWTLWLNDQHQSGTISGPATQAADELMQALAAQVFAQYAIPAAATGEHAEWRLHVQGVDGVGAYSALLGMLRRLGTQQQPRLLSIEGDEVVLQVSFPGSEEQLERMLGLDMRLQRIEEPVSEPEPEPEFESVQTEPTDLPLVELDPDAPASPVAEAESAEMAAADEEDSAAPDVAATQQPVEPAAPALPTLYFRWRG